MRLFVLTPERGMLDEWRVLNFLMDDCAFLLHLRKPGATKSELFRLLSEVKQEHLSRIVLHDHFDLLNDFPTLRGVHLNSRNPAFEHTQRPISVSRSCHSLAEIRTALTGPERCDYVFLSPIFDSISKAGYVRAFTHDELAQAADNQMINERVIALGGMDAETIPLVKRYNFGGAAVLGALWTNFPETGDRDALLTRLRLLHKVVTT